MKALVVDDSMTMRMVEKDILETLGLEVECAEDGAAALKMIDGGEYGVVLLDWNMPKLLGIDVVRAVRSTGNTTPIIIVTTEGQPQNILEAIKEGVNDYITKPFFKDALIERVRRFLPRERRKEGSRA